MNIDNINLRSEEVQEVLSKPPHILIRAGISVLTIIIFFIFVGSFFFSYPDIIKSKLIITTENPPIWIMARSTGKLKEIFINDLGYVEKGVVLAVIENSSNTEDVLQLQEILSKFVLGDSLAKYYFPEDMNLGIIQPIYSDFKEILSEYENFFKIDLYSQKIHATEQQLIGYQKYIEHLQNIIEINNKNIELTKIDHKREKELYDKNLISLSLYEESEKKLLSAQLGAEQIRATLATATIEAAQLNNLIIETKMQQEQEVKTIKNRLQSSLGILKNTIKEWEQMYLLRSSISGVVSFNNIWKENQNINEGDKIFSIINNRPGEIIGRAKLPIEGAGKVKIGQRVNIHIDDYPYMEYGFLTGRVSSISLLSGEDGYTVIISIPQNMRTSNNKMLTIKGELFGMAEIVMENRSIGARILSPFEYLFKRNIIN